MTTPKTQNAVKKIVKEWLLDICEGNCEEALKAAVEEAFEKGREQLAEELEKYITTDFRREAKKELPKILKPFIEKGIKQAIQSEHQKFQKKVKEEVKRLLSKSRWLSDYAEFLKIEPSKVNAFIIAIRLDDRDKIQKELEVGIEKMRNDTSTCNFCIFCKDGCCSGNGSCWYADEIDEALSLIKKVMGKEE